MLTTILANMSFCDEMKRRVWEHGVEVKGYDRDRIRKDACGAWIVRDRYGDADSIYGWEIDHVKPKAMLEGKSQDLIDHIDNLRPMNCANNRSKGDSYPGYTAVLVAEGEMNVECSEKFFVNSALVERLNALFGEEEK